MLVLTGESWVGDHVGEHVVEAGDGVPHRGHGGGDGFRHLHPEEGVEELRQVVPVAVALSVRRGGALARQASDG